MSSGNGSEDMKKRKSRRFGKLAGILCCFLGLAVFLLVERNGIQYQSENHGEAYLPENIQLNMKTPGDQKTCILIWNSDEPGSASASEQLQQILLDMRVSTDVLDMANEELPEMSGYETSVIAISNLGVFEESILDLCDWVSRGGRTMFALPMQKEKSIDLISGKLGILDLGYENVTVETIVVEDGFMVGGNKTFQITDPYESSMQVRTGEQSKVYATDGTTSTPLIWEQDYGDGKFVVNNMGFCEKAYRGFYAASYSLLEDVCVYPVINASTFYIDDFPSPVPSGDGTYIRRDYATTIDGFYTNIWWPDMIKISEKYNMVYTGMLIENYDDKVSGELVRNQDISRYHYFGNMLMDMGGELGFHGYNHQPLCTDEFEYVSDIGYEQWESREKMIESVRELEEFSKEVFPGENFSVYVPPSNILSEEGRHMLEEEFPEIKTVASIYFPGESSYEQEFEVAEDGMVETPRIISGCDIDDYMEIAAFSELNMHFVNSHFLHPDDLLDEDRGAAKGWKHLKETWESYLEWLYQSAPSIRNLSGSQMAGAVERYCGVSLWKEDTPDDFYLTVDGLYDDAYMFVRVNEGKLGAVKGGTIAHITGNLYLLHVQEPEIEIKRSR